MKGVLSRCRTYGAGLRGNSIVIRWEEEDCAGWEIRLVRREIIVCQMFRRWVAGGLRFTFVRNKSVCTAYFRFF